MKIRNGFVSNSSSSSFIFAFNEIPTKEELLEKMFNNAETISSDYDDESVRTSELIERFHLEISHPNASKTEEELIEHLSWNYDYYYNPYDLPQPKKMTLDTRQSLSQSQKNAYNSEWNKYRQTSAAIEAKKFLGENTNAKIVEVEIHDSGTDSMLESGDYFTAYPFIKISNH